MSIQAHVDSLSEKRELIKAQVSRELTRPVPDFTLIHELKKTNLHYKEEMQHYLRLLSQEAATA